MDVVLDASALAKVFLNEEHAEALRAFVEEAIEEGYNLSAPDLIGYEVGNIVSIQFADRDTEGKTQILEDALTLVRQVPVEDETEVVPFTGTADSFYDASYLWLANQEGANLLTYDDRLQAAAQVHDVDLLEPTGNPA